MIKIDDVFQFSKGDKVVVGCSTGPDSMALLDMLIRVRNFYDLFLIVAHVNHNVREQSSLEEKFLKNYCMEHSIIFESMIIENYGDDNFHNEARNIRYHFFETIVLKYEAQYLMTAHHGDDFIETILMRIVRGSNLNGYSGFKKVIEKDQYTIVRPLIRFTKDDLLQYDIENNVPYFIDSSNEKDVYTRNRYRKYMLPFLKREDPDVHLKFYKFGSTLSDAYKFINHAREDACGRVIHDDVINIDLFFREDSFIQKEILYYLLGKYYQDDLMLIHDRHIDLILKFMHSKKANGFINLPNDVIAKKNYNCFELVRDTEIISTYEIEFDQYAVLPNNHTIEKISYSDDNSNNICRLDSSEILLPLIVRSRKIGDRIRVKGLNGSRKVKDIFIDKKISIVNRDIWPIVMDSSGEIVWIPGIKKSVFDKKKTESYDIILKYV